MSPSSQASPLLQQPASTILPPPPQHAGACSQPGFSYSCVPDSQCLAEGLCSPSASPGHASCFWASFAPQPSTTSVQYQRRAR